MLVALYSFQPDRFGPPCQKMLGSTALDDIWNKVWKRENFSILTHTLTPVFPHTIHFLDTGISSCFFFLKNLKAKI